MTKTYGIDVSHWEGTIDWQTAAEYVNFCIMKATDGTSFVDPEFSNNKAGCIANNVPWGAYHFFHPTMDPIAQAAHFVGTVGSGCNVYVADVETVTLEELGEGADFDALLDGIVETTKQFLDHIEQLTGKKPMIYTSPGFWNFNMVPTPSWTSDYDLWVAHWGASEPIIPNGWSDYVIHQFGDSGQIPGIPGGCDEDWFNGDLVAVLDYFGTDQLIRFRVKGPNRGAAIMDDLVSKTIIGWAVGESEWSAYEIVTSQTGGKYYRIGEEAYIPEWLCEKI